MALEITVRRSTGMATAKIVEGPEGITQQDMQEVKAELLRRVDWLHRVTIASDSSGSDWANIYEEAKVIGELATIVRRYCVQWELGGFR